METQNQNQQPIVENKELEMTPEQKEPVADNSEVLNNAPAEPLYKGLIGEVKDTEELKNYVKRLEDQIVQAEVARQNKAQGYQTLSQPVIAPEQTQEEKKGWSELFYSDPDQTVEKIRNTILAEVEQKFQAKEVQKQFWNDFYKENPDLQPVDRLVQSVIKDKYDSLKNIPLPEAKKILAKEARDIVGLVKQQFGVSEKELKSGTATTLGASGSPVQKAKAQAQAPVSFIEQFKKLRRR